MFTAHVYWPAPGLVIGCIQLGSLARLYFARVEGEWKPIGGNTVRADNENLTAVPEIIPEPAADYAGMLDRAARAEGVRL
jgi:hypothetical protein